MRLPAVYAPTYPAPTARRSPQALADLSATAAPVPHAIEQVATDPAKQARAACDFPVRLTRWRGTGIRTLGPPVPVVASNARSG
jgi:hypothetical protein